MSPSYTYNDAFNIKPYVEEGFDLVIKEFGFQIFNGRQVDFNGDYIFDRYFTTLDNEKCAIMIGFALDSQYSDTRIFILQYYQKNKPFRRFSSYDLFSFRKEPSKIFEEYSVENENWENEDHFVNALKQEAIHSLTYRKDILDGDFESWRTSYLVNKYGTKEAIPAYELS